LAQRQWIARIWPHKLPRFDLLCHYAEAGYSLAELSGAARSGIEPSSVDSSSVGPSGGVQSGRVHGDFGNRAAAQGATVSGGTSDRQLEPAGPSRSAPQTPQPQGTNQPRPAPRLLAICGIDGAGKSSHLAALAEHLTSRGLRVGRFKLFRHGLFHATVTDLARRTRGGRRLCLWRTERLIKVYDSLKYFASTVEPELANYDVVLFDRYSYTHEAAALGRLWHLAGLEPLLERFPRPDRVWLLDLPAERAVERLGERGERTIDEHLFMLDRFRRRLLVAAEREGFSVLDARLDFAVNQARLRAECEALLFGAEP
jgi:dTMP kinase